MIVVQRILVPVDFSDSSRAAVKYGVALARLFKAALILLHVEARHDFEVIVEGERVVEEGLANGAAPPQADEVVHSAARILMSELLTASEEGEIQIEYELRASGAGGPAAEIMQCTPSSGKSS